MSNPPLLQTILVGVSPDVMSSSCLTRRIDGDTYQEQERAERKKRKKERKLLEAAQASVDGDGMEVDSHSQGKKKSCQVVAGFSFDQGHVLSRRRPHIRCREKEEEREGR